MNGRDVGEVCEQPDNQVLFGAAAREVSKWLELLVRIARGDADVCSL